MSTNEIKVFCAHDMMVALSELKPNPKNPNTHPDVQIKALAKIIEAQGWRQPIKVSNRSGYIVSGHGRYKAAQLLECERVPVDFQDYDSEELELADLLADNRIAELAEIDNNLLAEIFISIDLENIELTGYEESDIKDLIHEFNGEAFDVDEADNIVPEPEDEPITKEGDVWILGNHKLVCGDSTRIDVYEKIMDGEEADLVVTDPPYNVDYEGTAGSIKNDNMEAGAFREFLSKVYSCLAAKTKNGGSIYVFHSDSSGQAFRSEMESAGFLLKECLIWVKNAFTLGRQDYQWRHEPCLYGWKDGASHYFTKERNKSTVFDFTKRPDFKNMSKDEIVEFLDLLYDEFDEMSGTVIYCDKPTKSDLHPTMKPIRLLVELIGNSSVGGGVGVRRFWRKRLDAYRM